MSLFFKSAVLILLAACAIAQQEEEGMFPKEKVFKLVKMTCRSRNFFCPKDQYLVKVGPLRLFNKEAVMDSKAFATFNAGYVGVNEFIDFFRKEFCCTDGPCQAECGIHPINEKGIIRNFHLIYKQVFALNVREINQYENDYLGYLEELQNGSQEGPAAEIEELYDYLHYNEDKIIDMLAKAHKQ